MVHLVRKLPDLLQQLRQVPLPKAICVSESYMLAEKGCFFNTIFLADDGSTKGCNGGEVSKG